MTFHRKLDSARVVRTTGKSKEYERLESTWYLNFTLLFLERNVVSAFKKRIG